MFDHLTLSSTRMQHTVHDKEMFWNFSCMHTGFWFSLQADHYQGCSTSVSLSLTKFELFGKACQREVCKGSGANNDCQTPCRALVSSLCSRPQTSMGGKKRQCCSANDEGLGLLVVYSVITSLLLRTMYLLGYIPKDNRLYLSDKDMNVVGYSLLLSVLEYQTAVMREDFDTAKQVQSYTGHWTRPPTLDVLRKYSLLGCLTRR